MNKIQQNLEKLFSDCSIKLVKNSGEDIEQTEGFKRAIGIAVRNGRQQDFEKVSELLK